MTGWCRENRFFIIVFVISVVLRIVFLPGYHEVWWDSGVYMGMGKFLWSFGSSGLWEHIRPVFWPVILGFLWLLKLSPVFFGRLLEFLLGTGCIFLFYLLSEKYFNKKSAVYAVIIFSFSSIFFFMGFRLYTEIPVLFAVLLAVLLFEKEYYLLSGFVVALAFLTKFPAAVFLVPLVLLLFLRFEFKNAAKLLVGFSVPALIFFIFNFFMYQDPFLPLIDAQIIIAQSMGCNFLRKMDWWFYSAKLLKENWFHLFAFPGLYLFIRKYRFKQLLPALFFVIPFVYFTQMSCRDYRYMIFFLPFICMFSGSGIDYVFRKKKKYFLIIVLVLLCFSVFQAANYFISNELSENPEYNLNYIRFLEGKSPVGEVWVSNPLVAVYSDELLKKIYYTDFNSDASTLFYDYLSVNSHDIQYVFLDNCGGGIMCYPTNEKCKKDKDLIFSYLDKNFNLVFDENYGLCFYRVYENPLF